MNKLNDCLELLGTRDRQIAELEAQLAEALSKAAEYLEDNTFLNKNNNELRETIEILKQALDNAHKDKAVF